VPTTPEPPTPAAVDAVVPGPDTLAAWRADDAIEERRRRWWARRRLDEEAGLAGALLGRAEAGRPVALEVAAGRRLTGHLWWVGPHAVALRAGGGEVLVDLAAVVSVRDAPGRGSAPLDPGPRDVAAVGEGSLAEVLAGLAGDRPPVTVHARDGRAVATGTLVAVGRDVVVVDEPDGERALVAAHALGWVHLGD
jgi:hypothetical protein